MTKSMKSALRKPVSFILVFMLIVSLLSPAGYFASAADEPSGWAREEIDEARLNGLITPMADRNYLGNINRVLFCAQIVNLVETALGAPVTVNVNNPFTDISNESVMKAYQLGIVTGKTETTFDPFGLITRQEIAAMMMRSARALDLLTGTAYSCVMGAESIVFADQIEIAPWALPDVQAANMLDILRGVGENRIDPLGNATVEQSIIMVNRLFKGFAGTPISGSTDTAPAALSNPVVFTVYEQNTLELSAEQLANDPDGDHMTVVAVNGQTQPFTTLYGTVGLTSDGGIIYTAGDVSEESIDDFPVTVSDGTHLAHVNVRVKIKTSLTLTLVPSVSFVSVIGTPSMSNTLSVYLIQYLGSVPSPAPALSYQWMVSSSASGTYTDIPGAIAPSYVIPEGSIGKYLKVRVTASGSAGGSADSLPVGPVVTGFAGGDGTAGNPYRIATAEQLMLLDIVTTQNRYFQLTDDLVLPVDAYIRKPFAGFLNGNDNSVTLQIHEAGQIYAGLFSRLLSGSAVNRLTVFGSVYSGYSYVGAIAGHNEGIINQCSARIHIEGESYVGGLVGYNKGTISRSNARPGLLGYNYVGGLAGANNGIILRSMATIGDGNYIGAQLLANAIAGGLVGYNLTDGSVTYCYSELSVNISANYAGGLIGHNAGSVYHCYSIGSVNGAGNEGGLIGSNNGGSVTSSYYNSDEAGTEDTDRGTPLTSSEMMWRPSFVGWDFTNIWSLPDGAVHYPFLF
jgi:hypothetical protein